MVNNKVSFGQILFLILFLTLPSYLSCQTSLSVSISNLNINAATTYTYLITFSDSAIRSLLNLNFPSQVALGNISSIFVNSTALTLSQYTVYSSNNSIVINKTMYNSVNVTVTNVKNPPSAISTFNFTISSNNSNDSLSPSIYNMVNYSPGSLQSCLYAFSGTTQQTNSTLNTTILLKDQIPTGNSKITISYPIKWDNSNTKSLTYGGVSITCTYSVNKTSTIAATCSYDSTNVYVSLNLTTAIASNSTVSIVISGVNNPPTAQTVTSTNFKIATYDYAGYLIDSLSSCNVSDTTLSSSSGFFTNSNLNINAAYNSPQINFTNSVPVTFQSGDSLEATYPLSTTTCSTFTYLIRNSALTWTYYINSNGVRYYNCSTTSDNTFTTTNLQLYLDCSLTLPPSAQPSTFIFLFKRNSTYYLNLTATLTAQAIAFTNTSKFAVSLSSTSAVLSSTYTFSIVLSQPLSNSGAIWLLLPSVVNFTSFLGTSSCSATLNGASLTIFNCTYSTNSSAAYVVVNFNASSTVLSNSQIVLTISGLANPRNAYISYGLGIYTYFNASQNASLVEYNSSISTVTYTTYNTLNLYLTPNAYNVFSTVSANISYKNEIYLNAGIVLAITFPSAVSSVNFSSIVYANSTLTIINSSTISSTTPITLSITYNYDIPIGTNITIPFTMKSPSNLGTYGPINFMATKNGNIYEQSSFLKLYVNQTSPIDVKITAPNSNGNEAGASTNLQFSMSSYIAHSTPYFFMLITVPSDTGYTPSGTCSGSCYSSFQMASSTVINITINNSYSFSSNFYNYSISVGTFKNPRHLGVSSTWLFQTYNKDDSQVGTGNATFLVSLPNVLTGSLSLSDRYYRNNSNSVKLSLNLWNTLIAGDYLLIQFGSNTYTSPSNIVSCPLVTCSISNQSTSNVLVIVVTPNLNQLNVNSISLQISGLLSSDTTIYNEVDYFNVSSYASGGILIDQGSISYNVSCGENPSYSCRQCYGNGSCISCYTNLGMNKLNDRCVFNCTSESQFRNFNQNGTCQTCVNACYTCYNQTYCRSCVTNYYYYDNYTCLPSCATSNSYYATNISGVVYCLVCYDTTLCLSCTNSSSNGCTKCSVGVLDKGTCKTSCSDSNTFISSDSVCTTCDVSCNGCTGPSLSNCKVCNYGYFNYSNYCVSTCPNGTAPILYSQSCACEGNCSTCQNSSTYCLTCTNDANNQPLFAYLGQCLYSCPLYTYLSAKQCLTCGFGCYNCTVNTCFNCDKDKYSYQNKCYQDCNSVGLQYDGSTSNGSKVCVMCPNGCDTCDGVLCSSCLANYSLQNNTCLDICLVLGNCASPVPSKVIPLPGLISIGIWGILVLILKLLQKKLYAPFSLLFCYCIVELVLIIVTLSTVNKLPSSANSVSVARMLVGMDYSYRATVKALLIASLAINYVTNVLYLIIFCKYMRPLILVPRQIDYIVNGVILTLASITNYRFGVVAYSKMFPKPEIRIENASRLTPINYLLITSIILDVIPLVSSVILVYKQQALTDTFMLGIDLLVILGVNLAVSILTVALPKPQDYYDTQIKKTDAEENYNGTEQDINNQKNKSFNKLVSQSHNLQNFDGSLANEHLGTHYIDNNTILLMANNQNDFLISSEEQNPPLNPIVHSTTRKVDKSSNLAINTHEQNNINLDQIIILQQKSSILKPNEKNHKVNTQEMFQNKKTKRLIHSPQKVTAKQKHQVREEENLQRKIVQKTVNFSKEKVRKQPYTMNISTSQIKSHQNNKLNIKHVHKQDFDIDQAQISPVFVKGTKNINQKKEKEIEPTAGKGQNRQNRKKTKMSETKIVAKSDRVFALSGQQKSSQQSVNIDLILESKIKNSKFIGNKLQQKVLIKHDKSEDISPSWFNNKNQRVDLTKVQNLQ